MMDYTRLLLKAGRGDMKAFEQLYAALWPVVTDYIASLDGSMGLHQREDLVQEALFRTWSNLARFRGEASAKTFVFAIAKHVLRQELSRRGKLPTFHVADVDGLAGTYVFDRPTDREDTDRVELRRSIEQALAKLPLLQREAFQLICGRGISVVEAAKLVGCSYKVFRRRLDVARKKLQASLRKARL